VETVARLRTGQGLTDAGPEGPRRALLRAASTNAHVLGPRWSGVTGLGHPVDDTVTVVVEVVADLRARPGAALAHEIRARSSRAHADRRTELADADVRPARLAGIGQVVVFGPIAVVVEVVTGLGEIRATLAAAGHVVDDAVAVVVDAVAHLGPGGARG